MIELRTSLVILTLLIVSCKEQKKGNVSHTNSKAVAMDLTIKSASEGYLKAWSDNDTVLMQTIAIRNIVRNVNGEITSSNQSGLAQEMKFWHTAIPDFKVVEREIIVVGNRTYANWTCTGTNTGMFGDTPPTGKKSITEGFSILTFDDAGQLVHENAYYDQLGVMEDWGYTVTPPIME